MIKKYEVKGMMEWHPVFAAGRARIRVPFTGGHLGDGCSSPAIFETSDAVLQSVIERSVPFRNGRIRLAASFPEAAPKRGAYTSPKSPAPAPLASPALAPPASVSQISDAMEIDPSAEVMEFDNFNDAVDFLQFQKKVGSSILFEAQDCINEARKLGINMKIKDV